MLRRDLVFSALVSLVLFTSTPGTSLCAQEPVKPSRWAAAINEFEQQDKSSPVEPGGVVFVGSSSIRMWDLEKSFPNEGYLNRGFGGSQIADSIQFARQLVLRHKPQIVVMYAGDNDVAAGKTAKTVAADFRKFREILHKDLPNTQLIFIAIKPSLKRWDLWSKMESANRLVRKQCREDDRLSFADIITPMLGPDGQPRPELFAKDGLHLNARGYEKWETVLKSELKQAKQRIEITR